MKVIEDEYPRIFNYNEKALKNIKANHVKPNLKKLERNEVINIVTLFLILGLMLLWFGILVLLENFSKMQMLEVTEIIFKFLTPFIYQMFCFSKQFQFLLISPGVENLGLFFYLNNFPMRFPAALPTTY